MFQRYSKIIRFLIHNKILSSDSSIKLFSQSQQPLAVRSNIIIHNHVFFIKQLLLSLRVIQNIHKAGGTILFIGSHTKPLQILFSRVSQSTPHIFVMTGWIGGLLTNWNSFTQHVNQTAGSLVLRSKYLRFFKYFSIIQGKKKPNLVVVFNLKNNQTVLRECYLENIPVVVLNFFPINPILKTYQIFGNTQSFKVDFFFFFLFLSEIFDILFFMKKFIFKSLAKIGRNLTNNPKFVRICFKNLHKNKWGAFRINKATLSIVKPLLLRISQTFLIQRLFKKQQNTQHFVVRSYQGKRFEKNWASRLDWVLYQSRFYKSVFQSRKAIRQGLVKVNGFYIKYPNIILKEGDLIEVPSHKFDNYFFSENQMFFVKVKLPTHLEISFSTGSIVFCYYPKQVSLIF